MEFRENYMNQFLPAQQRSKAMKVIAMTFTVLFYSLFLPDASAERFFQTNNTWYEKVPVNPILNPSSVNHVNDILINSKTLSTSYREWSVTVWRATNTTPMTQVIPYKCAFYGKCDNPPTWQKEGWDLVPIPTGAIPSGNDKAIACAHCANGRCRPDYCHDGKMVVISADGKYAWEFGHAFVFPKLFSENQALAGKIVTTYLRKWDLSGDGVNYPFDKKGGPTYAKVPLLHGLITYNEVVNEGRINHALAFAYNGAKKTPHWNVYPSGVYTGGISSRPGAMLGGERLVLDRSVNCDALPTFPFAKIVCKAMQEYGMIFMENSGPGSNSVYAEDLTGKPYSWSGIIKGSLSAIPLDKLKVVEPIYPLRRDGLEKLDSGISGNAALK